jgi:hypothetical protein
MATSFSGGRSWKEPPTMGKQLVNFITCGCESSAPFLDKDGNEVSCKTIHSKFLQNNINYKKRFDESRF